MPASAVPRTRLLRRVAAADTLGRCVTLVSAPAGSGKTMLLAQCWKMVRSQGAASAWLSLDSYDNDPSVLWAGILRACGRAMRGVDPPAEVRLAGLSPPTDGGDRGFVGAFFEAIESIHRPLWIVLDDVQQITSDRSLAGLAALIRNRPAQVRLLLGSRFDPPLPLARMIVDGEAWEIRASDLALDRAEAEQLLRSHAVPLDADDLALLLERTEGWAAGLRMAALSLAGQDDVSKYIADFAGDDRPLADYLVAEVLAALSDDVVDLLIATSVVETLTPDLASRLSGRQDAGAVLAQLARDNALVYRVGRAPTSFRLHGLLRSFLLAEGGRRNAQAQRLVHLNASEWFEEHHLPAMALDQAAAGTDWPRAIDLIDRHGLRLLLAGDGSVLSRTVRLLSDELVSRPATALMAALAALDSGEVASAGRYIDLVGRRPEAHRDRRLRLLHVTALMFEARMRGDRSSRCAELIALSDLPVMRQPDLELLAAVNRGILRLWLTEYHRAEADLVAALRMARQDECDALELECLSHLSVSAAAIGEFAAVERRTAEAIDCAARRGWSGTPRTAPAYLVAAEAAWQRLDNDAASAYLAQVAVTDDGLEPEVRLSARLLGVFLAVEGSDNRRETIRQVRAAWPHGEAQLLPVSVAHFCLTELRMANSVGDHVGATDSLARAERLLDGCGDVLVMRALSHAHLGRRAAAVNSLAPVLSGAAACLAVNSEITAWLLSAHFCGEMGEPARAHEAVVRALDLAAPRQLFREFVAASTRVRSMLVQNEGRFAEHERFVTKVIAARRVDELAAVYGETLTSRELDLLRDLPSRLSLLEIADARVLSVNTVKTHVKAVYRKFNVGNRRQAVDRARELGLL